MINNNYIACYDQVIIINHGYHYDYGNHIGNLIVIWSAASQQILKMKYDFD